VRAWLRGSQVGDGAHPAHACCGPGFRTQYANQCQVGPQACAGIPLDDQYTRHNGGSNLAFTDGHVKWFKAQTLATYQGTYDDGNP
jgi:prepilin-type processing-associated H-X9-DG protein